MYRPVLDAVAGSLTLTALVALLPLVVLFVMLGVLRISAWKASLVSLIVSILVAIIAYSMPVGQAVMSGLEGAAFGFFPILWIVINAIWLYNMTVVTGHFDVLRRSFARVSDDQRIQAVIIAFCFGALLEALAGFGTPVAITTLATVSGIPEHTLSQMVGRQTPILGIFVPMALVYIIDRGRGVRATLPATLTAGIAFALAQFATSNYLSTQLTDIVASLVGAAAVVLLLRVWRPATPYIESEEADIEEREAVHVSRRAARTEDQVASGVPAGHAGGTDHPIDAGVGTAEEYAARDRAHVDTRSDVVKAYAPYIIIIIIFSLSQLPGIKDALAAPGGQFKWPGLDLQTASGKPSTIPVFKLNWLSAAGTLMLIAGVVSIPVIGISVGKAARAYLDTLRQLLPAIITVMAVLGLAYVMNASGQTASLGLWMAGAGSAFAIISPVLGWLGVAVTGSDTSSNSLFGALQVSAANQVGLSKVLMAAANSSGGVLGKMISPQNLAIAAAAVGLSGREGDIFRRIIGWSLGFLVFMCVLVYLQSTPVLSWMVP